MIRERLRDDLPTLPPRIQRLPVHRGYPVPWFVQWIKGEPEFRVMDRDKLVLAVRERRCWVCGEPLGKILAFVIGPMCAVTRISAEPPCHLACAEFSARACPFLSRPHMVRREGGIVEIAENPAGHMIRRNPGVALVWVCQRYQVVSDGRGGVLFDVGTPTAIHAYAEGRTATPDELRTSIETGLPLLRSMAEQDGSDALRQLEQDTRAALRLLKLPRILEEVSHGQD